MKLLLVYIVFKSTCPVCGNDLFGKQHNLYTFTKGATSQYLRSYRWILVRKGHTFWKKNCLGDFSENYSQVGSFYAQGEMSDISAKGTLFY